MIKLILLIASPFIGFFLFKWIAKKYNMLNISNKNNYQKTMELLENEKIITTFGTITLSNFRLICRSDDGSTTRNKSIMLEQLSSSEFKYIRKTFLTFLAFVFGTCCIWMGILLATEVSILFFILCLLSILLYYLSKETFIVFTTSGNEIAVQLSKVSQNDVDKFINIVDQAKAKKSVIPESNTSTNFENIKPIVSSRDILESLEKLGKLRENGVLSEDEFHMQKKILLS